MIEKDELKTEEDVSSRLATTHSELRAWQDLLDNPQFAKLIAILQSQADSDQLAVFQRPLKGMDEVLEQEWRKGRICGLVSLTATVEGIMSDLQFDIEHLEGMKHGSEQRD